MFLYKYWFNELKKDILNKYNIERPIFTVGGFELSETLLLEWLNDVFVSLGSWICYKKIGHKFETTLMPACPSLHTCETIIDRFIATLPCTEKEILFTLSYTSLLLNDISDIIVGETKYNKKEIRKELLYLVANGWCKIDFFKGATQENKQLIYHLFVTNETVPAMLKSGYLRFEIDENFLEENLKY